jgi:hypothetical protein
VARESVEGEATETRSVETMTNAVDDVANTAGSRDSVDAGTASDPLIEQLFSQPACLRRGHIPEALQQQDARAEEAIIASDGSVRARTMNAAKSLRTSADCSSRNAAISAKSKTTG